ncbi:MAG: glycosyltransferase [Gammaproteobacteria bacterium]|nr:glycosyltransferase [Gammaproteobacteria bacterium]
MQPPTSIKRVAIVYHFFAHYREAVLKELLGAREFETTLVGDVADPDGSIPAWIPSAPGLFVIARCRKFVGRILWQSGLLGVALGNYECIIFLGNAQWPATWIAAVLARLSGKRVLFWTHGWTHQDHGIVRYVRNAFYRIAHGLLLYGERARNIGIANGFRRDRLYVIYNSLDYAEQKRIRSAISHERLLEIRSRYLTSAKGASLVVCTARITAACRFDLLIEALALLKNQGREIAAVLVGDGPSRATLERQASIAGVTLHFFGACYKEELLAELLMAADVCVSPGKVGLTAMHSLAYGTPVITHDNPEHQGPEFEAVVPKVSGDFFRQGDAADLARAINDCTSHPWRAEVSQQKCIDIIESKYNPEFQAAMIASAIFGRQDSASNVRGGPCAV